MGPLWNRLSHPAGLRVLVGMLVLHANQEVSIDRLIEAIRAGTPPATARTRIHGFVSQLRRALSGALPPDELAELVRTGGNGYLLRATPDTSDLAARTGNASQQTRSLGNIAYAYNELGRFAEAATFAEEALSVGNAIDDRVAVGTFQPHLARAYHGLGRYAEARTWYERAIANTSAVGLRVPHGISLLGLGDLDRDLGDLVAARRHWLAAHAILTELGDVRAPQAAARLAG